MSENAKVERPLPLLDTETRSFWESCQEDHLVLPYCEHCQQFWFPPTSACPRCLAPVQTYRPVSGRGEVYSYVIYHQAYHPAFPPPYNVVLIQLEEGPHMISQLIDINDQEIKVGMPVQVVFRKEDQGQKLPFFRPRST